LVWLQETSLEHFRCIPNDAYTLVSPRRRTDVGFLLASYHGDASQNAAHPTMRLGRLGGAALQGDQVFLAFLQVPSGPEVSPSDTLVWLLPFMHYQDICHGHDARCKWFSRAPPGSTKRCSSLARHERQSGSALFTALTLARTDHLG
jgi:hypothetical protein